MKKNTCFFIVLFFTISIFATDIRQIMFGNNYETIHEVDSNKIFGEYPDIKAYMDIINIDEFKWKDSELNNGIPKRFYRTFEQNIGNQKFIRVVKGACELTDDFILSWRNPDKPAREGHSYLTQLFYITEDCIYAIGKFTVMEAKGYTWENGTNLKYEMLEIIQRNDNVKGFLFNYLEDRIDHHNRAEENGIYEEVYANTAEYYRFDDIIENASEKCGNVKYLGDYNNIDYVLIEASQPLVDSKRPFMYTINNAFDGNTGTAYVENTDDNLFYISVWKKNINNDFGKLENLQLYNGYCLNEHLFKLNSRIKNYALFINYITTIDEIKYSNYISIYENFLTDSYNQQIININYDKLPFSTYYFEIKDYYKGEKYDDVCLSELNLYFSKIGYLFGD